MNLGLTYPIPGKVSPPPVQGYHIAEIPKGELGELSKIQEEMAEVVDANEQGIKIMELVELSDMLGAIELYLNKHFIGFNIDDLLRMSDVTQRAFKNGFR